jgi:hypothetical protein
MPSFSGVSFFVAVGHGLTEAKHDPVPQVILPEPTQTLSSQATNERRESNSSLPEMRIA